MRKWNTYPRILGLMILAVLAAPARGGGLTLKECLQAALADNPLFKESLLAVKASEQGVESAAMANPEDEPYASVQHMDQALSYIHHAINDLLQEKQAKLHSPADYEMHYDVVLPFKEDL